MDYERLVKILLRRMTVEEMVAAVGVSRQAVWGWQQGSMPRPDAREWLDDKALELLERK